MTTLVAFLFVIGVIVFVHELGHFVVARRCGVRVEVFSLGFGPKLVTFRRHGTDYCISAIPLGGYVKMAGERAAAATAGDEFLAKSKWQRCQILAAGPAMNLILATVIIAGVAFSGVDAPSLERGPAVVGAVLPRSPAERAGILAGDKILSVAGHSTDTWDSVAAAIGMRPKREVLLSVLRDGNTLAVSVTPEADLALGVGTIGVLPNADPVVASIAPGGAADRAGLRTGDIITRIDGAPAEPSQGLAPHTLGTLPHRVAVTVRRDTREHTLTIVPADTDGDIGYSAATPTAVVRAGALQAARVGIEWTAETGTVVLQTIHGLISGGISANQLMGPLGIAQVSGEAAEISASALFCIMALLSVNIGVFNLLPIPLLDGGHIMMLGIEAVMRRDFTTSARQMVARGGFAMLLILTVIVFYNDLSRLAWVQRLIGA